MKRLGMLLVLVSVGMFALGCAKETKKTPAPPKDETKAGAPESPTGETPPPAPATEPAKEDPAK